MKRNRKGFTIVELVIVIAVIAILAAVLIPTFSGLIKKANLSADQQAVRQMNTALAVEGAVENNDIFDVYDALAEMGMSAEDYKPLTEDTYFFWDAKLDRVLHVDKDYKVLYPAEYADLNYEDRTWVSLTQRIATHAPQGYDAEDNSVTVNSGAELAYVLDDINKGTANSTLAITIPEDGVDMMGAAFSVPQVEAGEKITITGGPIKNATAVDIGFKGEGTNEHNKGLYGCSLFASVKAGSEVVIDGVTFENLNVKNTHVSGTALLVGANYGNVTIKDVTIKNSTVIGHRNVGALVGLQSGKLTLAGDIKLENVNVQTVGGRSGMLIGIMEMATEENLPNKFSDSSTITMTNCSFGIYQCEQNTGANYGLKSDGKLYSWVLNADGSKADKSNVYDASALILACDGFDGDAGKPTTARNNLFNEVVKN